jgi:hypothetical protein
LPTHFMSNIISNNRIQVTVGNQSFSIPIDKMNELVQILSRMQGIQIQENPSPLISYQGRTLINE